MKTRPDLFWQAVSALFALALGALLWEVGGNANQLGRLGGSLKWQLTLLGGAALLLAALAGFILTWTDRWPRVYVHLSGWLSRLKSLGRLNLLVPLCLYAFYALLVFFPSHAFFKDPALFSGLWARLGLVFILGLAAAPFLWAAFPGLDRAEAAAGSVLLIGLLHRVLVFVPDVNASPFTLGWSEASRFYYGSLFQSAAVYGQAAALPFLHPSRYLLLSMPFLLPDLPQIGRAHV